MKDMEIEFKEDGIHLDREPSKLDRMAMYFSDRLRKSGIEHVFVSGYVAIMFGRNRASEDIDVVCEPVSEDVFTEFWDSLEEMECIITSDAESAYSDYLKERLVVRFAYKGEFIPNIEMKFVSNGAHREALNGRRTVFLNGQPIPVSPFELQIAYKLFLGSDKDIEDARFLFDLFKEILDMELLMGKIRELGIDENEAEYYLGVSDGL